ncbi:hypothetical protein I350_03136 [Cryptococcus amylolentus CBS 6273]|uniref:Major facilitator superfamily (MFS) profile domain-containing protein n=1 Tax=Cryptococcus amylolentus CBS 6273 TaxID=1296118 RepID=A0A1E3K9L1_9TREE|nr:hypothetical protein I350_03136 [Cryptococcus amylolentus CBS 6273]
MSGNDYVSSKEPSSPNASSDPVSLLALPSKKGPWQKFVSWIWDSDYYEKSNAERTLVFKLDCFMLTAMTLGWWVKNLDQSNAPYVSGMKESLHITGNQYTYMTTIYSAVVCVMQIPSNFIVLKVRPSWFLAASEIGWGVFTFAQAGAQSYQAMYGFRFCIALFESFYYPVAFFLLGSWYTKKELGKRISLWFVASPAGSAFSGYMQAGIYKNMNGLHGLEGWRWLYIMCGVITIPIGLLIFFLVPDFPSNTNTWYLTPTERELALARCARNGTDTVASKINKSTIFSAVKSWQFFILVPWFMLHGLETNNGKQFANYLKGFSYSVSARNILPSTMYIIQIPCIIFYAYMSDRLAGKGRVWVIAAVCAWAMVPTGILGLWAPSEGARMFAFLANGSVYVTPLFFTWVAELCHGETEKRAFITGAICCWWYCVDAWLPTIIWLQTDGPRFKKGFLTSFCAAVFAFVGVFVIQFFQVRDQRIARRLQEQREEEGGEDGVVGVEKGDDEVEDGDVEEKVGVESVPGELVRP